MPRYVFTGGDPRTYDLPEIGLVAPGEERDLPGDPPDIFWDPVKSKSSAATASSSKSQEA